ncbi:MAG: DUF4011 domain-containing protein, partial [Clostridia bacterium]|nr:DUF4011 domain-containing protein [Clostridia bacterium]
MAQKTRKLEEVLSLQAEVKGVVSYADYFAQRSVFYALRIVNDGKESVQDLTLTLSNENGLLLPCEKQIGEIPFESKVEIDLGCVLSPHYFVSATEVKEESIFIELKKEKKVILSQTVVVQALPFDYFEGTKGDNELLASFVRPRLADCVKIKSEVSTQLKKWGIEGEFCGYESSDKNTVRHTAAALFACLRRYSFAQKQADISSPVEAGAGIKLLSEKSASEIELALFFAGCLESMDLHPILVVGERHIACGVWLYENCFIDCVSDDTERLKQYLSDGINNLSCFDIADLFSDKSVAYSTSEKHFIQKLDLGDYYDKYVDVKRARIGKIYPLPLKAKTVKGYEILSEEEASPDAMPKNLAERKNLSLSGKQTKDKQWERRLLDLSMKNALLNFLPEKGGLQVLSVSPDQTLATFIEKGECRLAPVSAAASGITAKKVRFNVQKELGVLKELVNMEIAGGVFRTLSSEPDFQERALRLYRKSKEAEEESGTKILYLAFGFLKWFTKDEKTPKFAPLVLQPVALKKAKGGEGFDVVSEGEEFSVNSTLLEFLKQE